ncbi:hypothetical protein JL720_13934 [Aureococcus anophagefferens]|nr:hypothetical protein JL720_13934 [Aureococcus anophagefferens]
MVAVLYVVLRLVVLAPVAFGSMKWLEKALKDTVRCTSHGKEVECLDVSTCERGVAKNVAIASVFDAHVNIEDMCGDLNHTRCTNETAVDHRLKLAALGRRAGVDVIFVVPRRDLQLKRINGSVVKRLAAGGVDVHISEWITPPNLSPDVPLESGGCCGAREFMKLAAYGFADYDALIVVDNDFDVNDVRDLWPIFDCAAQGHVSRETGWNGAGWGPFHYKFDARMQGFIYWFFYQNADADPRWKPVQVDPCVWNVQGLLKQMCKAEICRRASVAAGHIGLIDEARRALDC